MARMAAAFQLVSRFTLRLFEIASVLVRFDHVARFIVNANHSTVRPATKRRVFDCIANCVRLAVNVL